jgi:hypothetical protein
MLKKYFIFIVILSCFLSCKEENVKLDSNEKYQVDTLSAKKIAEVNKELDIFWKTKHDSLVRWTTDSLVAFQIKSIEERLKK